MSSKKSSYHGYRFPAEMISHSVWLYHRFCLSLRDVEDLLAERGIEVSYESIRHWCAQFGPEYTRKLKKRRGSLGDTWYLDEVFTKIHGEYVYLWRAVIRMEILLIFWCRNDEINWQQNAYFINCSRGNVYLPGES